MSKIVQVVLAWIAHALDSCLLGLEAGVFTTTGVLMGLFGADAVHAHQLAINFASLNLMVPLGIAQAAPVRVALQLGARRSAAARDAGFIAVAMGAP